MQSDFSRVIGLGLVLALSSACHDVPQYGQGTPCATNEECRDPLACINGVCVLLGKDLSGGAANTTGAMQSGGGSSSVASTGAIFVGSGGASQVQAVTGGAPATGGTCTPASPIRWLTFHWLGRSCGTNKNEEVVFTLNEVEIARVPLALTCDCTPGVGSVDVSDPALLAWGVNGANTFRATTDGELSWATVFIKSAQFDTQFPIWAAWSWETWDDALTQPDNMCDVGYQYRLTLSGAAIELNGGQACQ